MKKKIPIYPIWICHPCGMRHGNKKCGVATWHENTCDICGATTAVTEPRDFGHLKDTWIKAAEKQQLKQIMNTDTPRTDKKYESICESWSNSVSDFPEMTEFARQLERELTAARAEIERLDVAGIHSCHKDCQRPNCVLRRELKAVTEQRDTTRKLYDVACETAAKMHAAAVGEIKGPHIDPVQDILDLRRERDRLAEALERCLDNSWDGPMPDYARQSATEALAAVKGGNA